MSSFQAHVHYEQQYRLAVIFHYRELARSELLGRIVMPLTDPVIQELAKEMAGELQIEVLEAVTLLSPAVRRLYSVAAGAEHG